MRIVSLLPSTTEILFALGAGDQVVGVTFECDHPAEARQRRIVSTSAMPEGLEPSAIDDFVAAAMRAGEDLYHLDEGALSGLDADLVVTQDLCAVCAVDVSVVDDALAHLGCQAEVLTIDPHTLDEVIASIGTLGRACGREEQAHELMASLRRRLTLVWGRTLTLRSRPRVLVLEWTDPPYAPGHWVPDMVEMAGGTSALGTAGEKSVAGHLGAGAPLAARRGRLRAVRLRPGRLRGADREAARRRGAAAGRAGVGGRRQRLLGPPRPAPGRRRRGACGRRFRSRARPGGGTSAQVGVPLIAARRAAVIARMRSAGIFNTSRSQVSRPLTSSSTSVSWV